MIKEKINNGYKDKKGNVYSKILEYHFNSGEILDLGRLISSSHEQDADEYGEGIGFYVFQDIDNPNIGYRVYREYNNKYSCDEKGNVPFIQKLQERQENVQLTDFPYGIITIDNRVVGQIIPFYANSISLRSYVEKNGWEQESLYLECLNILKELCANGVYYYDMNANNFVVTSNGVKLIDFEKHQVEFDKPFSEKQMRIIKNFKVLLGILSKFKIWKKYPEIVEANSFEEIERIIKSNIKKY